MISADNRPSPGLSLSNERPSSPSAASPQDPLQWQPPAIPAGVPDCIQTRFAMVIKMMMGGLPVALSLLVKPYLRNIATAPGDDLRRKVTEVARLFDWARNAPR